VPACLYHPSEGRGYITLGFSVRAACCVLRVCGTAALEAALLGVLLCSSVAETYPPLVAYARAAAAFTPPLTNQKVVEIQRLVTKTKPKQAV